MSTPIKLVHIISGLEQGGAETVLYRLLTQLSQRNFILQVISLKDHGVLGSNIQALNIPVFTLNLHPGLPDPRAIIKLVQLLRQLQPDLVQTWMYHADLIGGIAARLAGINRIVWNIRQSNLDPELVKRSTRLVAQFNAKLSHILPAHILCCSKRAQDIHIQLGYKPSLLQIIPNGFDTNIFYPCSIARNSIRTTLGIAPSTILIGLIARFDPQKDHIGFLNAAIAIAQQRTDCAFLLCGTGITWENKTLAAPIHAAGLTQRFHLLGPRSDMVAIHSSCDLEVCASAYGEGFPNAIAEAMACAIPCVVTDVGDAAYIVDNTGLVIQPRNTQAMTSALMELLNLPLLQRQFLGMKARSRIEQHYSLTTMAERYVACYQALLSGSW